MRHRYAPGLAFGIASPHGVALLPEGVGAPVAESLRQALDGGADIAALVSVLAESAGGSISSLPPFAFAVVGPEAVSVAVRGSLVASASDDAGMATEVSGEESSLVAERKIPRAVAITLAAVGKPFPSEEAKEMAHGVVLCAAVEAAWDPSAARGAAPEDDPGQTLAPPREPQPEGRDDEDSGFGPLWGASDWATGADDEDAANDDARVVAGPDSAPQAAPAAQADPVVPQAAAEPPAPVGAACARRAASPRATRSGRATTPAAAGAAARHSHRRRPHRGRARLQPTRSGRRRRPGARRTDPRRDACARIRTARISTARIRTARRGDRGADRRCAG